MPIQRVHTRKLVAARVARERAVIDNDMQPLVALAVNLVREHLAAPGPLAQEVAVRADVPLEVETPRERALAPGHGANERRLRLTSDLRLLPRAHGHDIRLGHDPVADVGQSVVPRL